MITAFHHAGFAAPIGEAHQMPMRKFALVAEVVRLDPGVELRAPDPLTENELLTVHTPEYVTAIRAGLPRPLAESQRFPWSPELFPSVCLTNGGCVAAARHAARHGIAAAIASGFHHSHADHGEGFCTFNGLILAADLLKASGEIQRLAILDLDLHYGNGTASLAQTRPHVRVLSIYGNDFMRGVPYRDVRIRHHEDGTNHHSVALPAGCSGVELATVLREHLPWLLDGFRPDLLLYQAGADPYFEDPYSPLKLGIDDLKNRDREVFEFARAHDLPIAWVLAGGYTRDIQKVVTIHANTFLAAKEVMGP